MALNNLFRVLRNSHGSEIQSLKYYTCYAFFTSDQSLRSLLSQKHQQFVVNSSILSKRNLQFNTSSLSYCSDSKHLYLQHDPDVFGDRKKALHMDEDIPDKGDIEEDNFAENPPSRSQKLSIQKYAKMIKEHLTYRRIKEALDVLEVRMAKEDRVKPDTYIYNLLISGCAKVGYTKKAFQLYNKMKQSDIKVTGGTYTSLFNACANSPWPRDGIDKAEHLRHIMLEKRYEPNEKNYNAMIKAYGRCGDIKTAFFLADEMVEKNLNITVESFNFLLQACASDKDFGFRHALLVWHKMYQQKLMPDIYSFNTLLRCVRDCDMGDLESIEQTLIEIFKICDNHELKKKYLNTSISDGSHLITNESKETQLALSNVILDETPNFLSSTPRLGSLVSVSEVKTPEDRLLLLGGLSGFLEEMKNVKVTPGIETFTALLEVVPSTNAAEKYIVTMIRKIGLKADIDFFNTLIKKRSMRFDYEGARKVLSMIKTAKLQPDIITFGVLALGCQTQDEARELLYEMREKGVRMNVQILGAMLRQGCSKRNFSYIYEIMQIAVEENIKPNGQFLRHLQYFELKCSKLIKEKHPYARSRNFKHNYDNFSKKLEDWYKRFGIKGLKLEDAIKKVEEKPYQQFKENSIDGFEKPKNEELRTKQKPRNYIKKIKPCDLDDDNSVIERIIPMKL